MGLRARELGLRSKLLPKRTNVTIEISVCVCTDSYTIIHLIAGIVIVICNAH